MVSHVMKRDNVFYYVRHVPKDLIDHYSVQRLCFSLKTKCESSANRSSRSITQRLDDYWYGVRFSKLDVPINNLIVAKQNNTEVFSKVVDALESTCIKWLKAFDIDAHADPKDRGVYLNDTKDKIASILSLIHI